MCRAAARLLLFALASTPAKAQLAGFGGGGGGDMMTQMAPMLEMMKAKMGKRLLDAYGLFCRFTRNSCLQL